MSKPTSKLRDLSDAVDIRHQSAHPRNTYDIRLDSGRIVMVEESEIPAALAARARAAGFIRWTPVDER